LNARQRGAFQQAAAQGQGAAYLGQNPALARRVNQLDPTGWRAQNVQNFIGSYGQRQPRGGPAAAAPGGAAPAPLPQPPASFVGPRGTQAGDQLTPYGMSQLGGMPGGNMADMMGGGGGGYAIGSGYGGPSFGPGGPYGGAGMGGGGDMFGAGGPFGGYSPAMQQVLQARMQGGGYGGGLMGQGGGMQGGGGGWGGNFGTGYQAPGQWSSRSGQPMPANMAALFGPSQGPQRQMTQQGQTQNQPPAGSPV